MKPRRATHMAIYRTVETLAELGCERSRELYDRLPESDSCRPHVTAEAFGEWTVEAYALLESFAEELNTADWLKLLDAARRFLDRVCDMTTEDFSRGGECMERGALRLAIDMIDQKMVAPATGKEVARAMPDVRS